MVLYDWWYFEGWRMGCLHEGCLYKYHQIESYFYICYLFLIFKVMWQNIIEGNFFLNWIDFLKIYMLHVTIVIYTYLWFNKKKLIRTVIYIKWNSAFAIYLFTANWVFNKLLWCLVACNFLPNQIWNHGRFPK